MEEGSPKPKVSEFVDESKEEGDMDEMDEDENEDSEISDGSDSWGVPNREITLLCDSVSLTDFGLISTFETDYTLEVVQHSVSIILIRQMYSTNVCTSFCLLRIFVPQNVIKSEPNLYLVVSLTDQWL